MTLKEVFVFDFEVEDFLEECKSIIKEAEERLKYKFSQEQLEKCMAYTIRKARLNGKKNGYIPLLFKDEINFIPRLDHKEGEEMSRWEPDEPKRIFTCSMCGEDICDGEECFDIEGEKFHKECVEDNAYDLLMEYSDISTHIASTEDLDDGSDAAYEYYRDEVRCRG